VPEILTPMSRPADRRPAGRRPAAGTIALLLALYFVQGLPFGFQALALPVYLRQQGVSLTEIGLVGVLAAPWMLKALWAPLVDRYSLPRLGRRRSWILPMQAGLALCCAAAAAVGGANLTLLLALVFGMNLFAATQDIAVDGLAVDLLTEEELGYGNAAQVVGYKLGMLTGGGLLVWASEWIGWGGLFLAMAALIAAVMLGVLGVKEPEGGAPEERETLGEVVRALGRALVVPGGGWLLLFVATYKLGESMVDTMFKPFLVDAGFTAGQIGLWVGSWGMVASVLGSLAGGVLASRLPVLAAVGVAAALRVGPMIGEWALASFGATAAGVIGVTCAEHFFGGALTTCMFAFMMSRVDRRVGASHYTLLASVEVLGKSPGSWLSGALTEAAGYAGIFAAGAALSLAFLGLLLPLRRRDGRR
jgi:PAT family beta-lactamase induction signal transducer AmpG